MAEDAMRSRLGRGLAALIGDVEPDAGSAPQVERGGRASPRKVSVAFLAPNPRNPRKTFAEADLEELAASIRARGLIQPIAVRPVRGSSDHFEIIAGERRWRAAQRAGLHDVPVIVLDVSDTQALELAIIENVQRADLDALEEAAGYQALIDEYGYGQDDVAKTVGKSRPHVANTLRLLKLSEPVKSLVRAGKLTAGHARMLVGQPNADALADEIVRKGLNVRQVEALVRQAAEPPKERRFTIGKLPKTPDTIALEKRLSDILGLDVSVDDLGDGGVVKITYATLEQLDEVIRRLEQG
jgi:ParB family chromosome partitioning protein